MMVEGALFLTAGYGTRDEPLSLVRPKCLLPRGDETLLARLSRQIRELKPNRIAANASRCPDEVMKELTSCWPHAPCELYFEERPLGASSTLARLSGLLNGGSWLVVNTDMVMESFRAVAMMEYHRRSSSNWTVLVGDMPEKGDYSPLYVGGDMELCTEKKGTPVHYWGISIIEPSVAAVAAELQASRGLFAQLAAEVIRRGGRVSAFRQRGEWLDMGSMEYLRENILSGGNRMHPSACVSSDVVLKGRWNVGKGCIIGSGAQLKDSVMLEGSTLESGILENSVLPWFCTSRGGERL